MIQKVKRLANRVFMFFFPESTKQRIVRIGALGIVVFLVFTLSNSDSNITETPTQLPPIVYTGTVTDVLEQENVSFVGTVRSVSEAQIQSEIGGRVTGVYVKPGDIVSAGTILASLENTTQQASLLQAEGAYEAALANAAQSEVSVDDAKNVLLAAQNNAVSTYRDAYTTANTVLLNTIDTFYGDPNSTLVPGVRISGANTEYLNSTRVALRTILSTWQTTSTSLSPSSELDSPLARAQENITLLIELTDHLITATSNADSNASLDGELVSSYTNGLNTARATLNTALSSLTSAETTLSTARENLRRAQIGGTQNTDVSLANAQVKQALGTLRSAQANYEKTVFRTPIAGTVNSMRVQAGDFISAFTQISEVANNDALQISIYAGESDLPRFILGGTVTINESTQGVITSIAPAIDSDTQKTEIKIATESKTLTNGSTATVRIDTTSITDIQSTPLSVPITAIKFKATDGSIFVVEDGKLVSKPVSIGKILGSYVTITEGIDYTTEFVLDARGLREGEVVEAIQK